MRRMPRQRPFLSTGREKNGLHLKVKEIHLSDDILNAVSIVDKNGNILIAGKVPESDYLAIYDKKMVWRSNLYIADGAQDWNNDNPWNAPADAIAYAAMSQTEKDKIKWWSPEWGYNDWNRIDTETIGADTIKKGLQGLPIGDGKQVINFVDYRPAKTLKDTNTKSVPYSFPRSYYKREYYAVYDKEF